VVLRHCGEGFELTSATLLEKRCTVSNVTAAPRMAP
jgi:hypothetical protein